MSNKTHGNSDAMQTISVMALQIICSSISACFKFLVDIEKSKIEYPSQPKSFSCQQKNQYHRLAIRPIKQPRREQAVVYRNRKGRLE